MPQRPHRSVARIGNDPAGRQAGEGNQPRDAIADCFHPFPLFERRGNRFLVLLDGFLERADLGAGLRVPLRL